MCVYRKSVVLLAGVFIESKAEIEFYLENITAYKKYRKKADFFGVCNIKTASKKSHIKKLQIYNAKIYKKYKKI